MNKNLYLVGFMGTGKSTLGSLVAEALHMDFLDSDSVIETQTGKPVAVIFKEDGESVFRALEREFIKSGHPRVNCVVACGGGILESPGILKELQALGVVILLKATPETILQRVQLSANRPLLNTSNKKEKIATLLKRRQKCYTEVKTTLCTDRTSLPELAKELVALYNKLSSG